MRRALLFSAALALSGCALLGKNEPLVPRYFTPEFDGDTPAQRAPAGLQLRLGRVEAWSHLRERIAARNSARELYYYEDRRWTERPEVYLKRSLSRALFEERGVTESLSGRALTLDVELIAFEEIEKPHKARLQALYTLRDDRVGLIEETVTVEEPVAQAAPGEEARAVVDALSQALHEGVNQIAAKVVAKAAQLQAAPRAAQ